MFMVYSFLRENCVLTPCYYFQIASLEEAVAVIDCMRTKYRCRGQQIIAYRKKLRVHVSFTAIRKHIGDVWDRQVAKGISKRLWGHTFLSRFEQVLSRYEQAGPN